MNMNKILVLVILLCSTKLYCQIKDDNYQQLIDSAIVINQKNLIRKNDIIYVINADNMRYSSFNNSLKDEILTIDIYNKKNKKRLKKGIHIWKIFPNMNKNKLIIKIVYYNLTFKHKNYDFVNEGGTIIVFEYSCKDEKWLLASSRSSEFVAPATQSLPTLSR